MAWKGSGVRFPSAPLSGLLASTTIHRRSSKCAPSWGNAPNWFFRVFRRVCSVAPAVAPARAIQTEIERDRRHAESAKIRHHHQRLTHALLLVSAPETATGNRPAVLTAHASGHFICPLLHFVGEPVDYVGATSGAPGRPLSRVIEGSACCINRAVNSASSAADTYPQLFRAWRQDREGLRRGRGLLSPADE
jgi:hypothetical protein